MLLEARPHILTVGILVMATIIIARTLVPKVPHAFDKAGNYTITLALRISSNPPQNASANIVVTITSPMTGTVAEGLVATIDANSTKSPAPATIEFGANATGGLAPYSTTGISVTGATPVIAHMLV